MTVCKHCGTEIEDGLVYCPNCGQSIDETLGDFFEPVEELEEEAYNIFDTPEEFDMDSLLEKEFTQGMTERRNEPELLDLFGLSEEEPEEFTMPEVFPESADFSGVEELKGMDFFGMDEPEHTEETASVEADGFEFPVAEETDFMALDDLFQDLDAEPAEAGVEEFLPVDEGLEELLAAGSTEPEEAETGKKKDKKEKPEKKSFFQTVFGNVPIDPSKVKKELTPEEIAAKKQKEEEEKKAKAEEKKLASEEKKQIAQRNKEEKARQKALAKEEKKAKKLQEAKLILEEMKETRINRLGSTIVFLFFAVCAVVIFFGSDMFGYAINVHSAEKNFNKACDRNVKYYTDAYNDIYGLEIKEEDQQLSDKIMTVMFVNKELNSYNSQMILKDYEAALHSLVLGLYRYGKYYETTTVISLGISKDLDFVRSQILEELDETFDVSEDEAELLRDMLEEAGVYGMDKPIDSNAAREYNQKLYEIVKESGLEDDSNN